MSVHLVTQPVTTEDAQKAIKWAIDILDIRLRSNAMVDLQSKSVLEQRKLYTKHINTFSTLLEEITPIG